MEEDYKQINREIGILKRFINRIRSRWFKIPYLIKLKIEFILFKNQSPHSLPYPLVISLTSHPVRFDTLHKTLDTLTRQSVKPDSIVLWIAEEHKELLPQKILNIKNVKIKLCKDLKSYKKIVPAIIEYKNSFIITADDDIYYPYRWVENFVSGYKGDMKEVLCTRAHFITLNDKGLPRPYLQWVKPKNVTLKSHLIFPTGAGGIFYPPNIFAEAVMNSSIFMKICPTADDLWLWWMVRLNGGKFRVLKRNYVVLNSSNFNQIGLWYRNINLGGNDRQMGSLIEYFGSKMVFSDP